MWRNSRLWGGVLQQRPWGSWRLLVGDRPVLTAGLSPCWVLQGHFTLCSEVGGGVLVPPQSTWEVQQNGRNHPGIRHYCFSRSSAMPSGLGHS